MCPIKTYIKCKYFIGKQMTAAKLQDNIYNRALRKDQPKFKLWSSVGLMLTYWCPIKCACCYVFSGPRAGSPDTEMSAEAAVAHWRSVRQLADRRGKVHITGGEPFGDFERLKKILQLGCEMNLGGLEKIETNAYWCTDDDIVKQRLTELKDLGLTKLQISSDVYHQQFVNIENVRRAWRIGREILGPDRIQVRWEDFVNNPTHAEPGDCEKLNAAFAKELQIRPERMLGRAAEKLANIFKLNDCDELAEQKCTRTLLGAGGIHIDGAGNIFSGTCIGIVTGKIDNEQNLSLRRIWLDFDYRNHLIWAILAQNGPFGLLKLAEPLGFRRREKYAGKCHLCYDTRKYLYHSGLYHEFLGPGTCYGALTD